MTKSTNDVSQVPDNLQFQMGATASEAENKQQIAANPIPPPGGIVDSQQYQLPRAEPDASMSRDHGTPYG